MKKIALLVATLALVTAAGSASAANSLNSGTFGFNVGTQDSFILNGKYLFAKDMAVLAGFGMRIQSGNVNSGNKGTDTGLMVGFRKYLKTDDFAPFIGGRYNYSSTSDSTVVATEIIAEAGVEYFLAKQFSIEGRVGFGRSSTEFREVGLPTIETNYIGSTAFGISANFYF